MPYRAAVVAESSVSLSLRSLTRRSLGTHREKAYDFELNTCRIV